MIIYHGSTKIVEEPQLGLGKPHNDFGRGFYCTTSIELAKEWACGSDTDGYANMYELDIENLQVLDLTSGEYNILNWLALLTRYRSYWQAHSIAEEAKDYLQKRFMVDISSYDAIVGYRADDSYFSFAQDFIMGNISLEILSEAMKLGKLGSQIVLKSEKAFDNLKYLGYELAYADEYFVKKRDRDKKARQEYRNIKQTKDRFNGILILDIMRGVVSIDELRI